MRGGDTAVGMAENKRIAAMALSLCLLWAGPPRALAQGVSVSLDLQDEHPDPAPVGIDLASQNPTAISRGARSLYLAGELATLLDALPGMAPEGWDPVVRGLDAGGLEIARDLIPFLGDKKQLRRKTCLRLMLALGAHEALIRSLHHSDPGLRRMARQGLVRMGAPAMTRLIEELRGSDRPFREEVYVTLESMGVVAIRGLSLLLDDEAFFSRVSPILIASGKVGFENMLNRWTRLSAGQRRLILRQMQNRRGRSQRILLGIMRFGSIDLAYRAIDVLALQGDAGSLVQALRQARKTIRERALSHLESMGDQAIPEIAKALRDREPDLRRMALACLENMGKPAYLSLAGLLKDGDPAIRLESVLYLIQAGEPGLTALGRVRAETDGKSLALLFPSLRKQGGRLLPSLLKALDAKDPSCILVSLELLAALDAWKELAEALGRQNAVLIPRLRDTLAQGGKAAVLVILTELDRKRTASRTHCLAVLDTLGSAAMPALVEALAIPALRTQATAMLMRLTRASEPGR